MPDPNEKMVVLAERLLDRTNRGEVAWELSARWSAEVFETDVGGQIITIRARDNDGNHPFQFGLWQVEKEDDPFSSTVFRRVESIESMDAPGDGAQILEQLYRAARSSALNINESIDAALAALDEEPTRRNG